MVAQICMDDIVFFFSPSYAVVSEVTKVMHNKFEMSMNGEVTYFLGLQVQPLKDGMFLSQSKYARRLVSKLDWKMHHHKTIARAQRRLDAPKEYAFIWQTTLWHGILKCKILYI